MRNYPDFVDAFLTYTEYVEAPEKFLRWSALSVVAGALGRKVWVNFKKQDLIFPNLYILLIGGAGITKKSTSSSFAVDLLSPIKGVRQMSTTFTPASLVEQLGRAGAGTQVPYKGKQYQHSSLFCYASEAVNTLKDKEGGVIHMLTDFYDCKPKGWNDEVAWVKETKGDGQTKIFNMCVNFLGCSTPDWLVKSLGTSEIQGGFASRVLFVSQDGMCDRDFGWDDLPDRSGMAKKLTEDLQEINALTGELKTSKEYKEEFVRMDRENKLVCLELGEGHTMSSYYARKCIQVLKVSQVLHVSKGAKGPITAETLLEAKELIQELEVPLTERLTNMASSEEIQLADKIWKRILVDPGVKQGLAISSDHLRGWFPQVSRQNLAEGIGHLVSVKRLSPAQYDKAKKVFWHEVLSKKQLLS